jgi:hypothetical protein
MAVLPDTSHDEKRCKCSATTQPIAHCHCRDRWPNCRHGQSQPNHRKTVPGIVCGCLGLGLGLGLYMVSVRPSVQRWVWHLDSPHPLGDNSHTHVCGNRVVVNVKASVHGYLVIILLLYDPQSRGGVGTSSLGHENGNCSEWEASMRACVHSHAAVAVCNRWWSTRTSQWPVYEAAAGIH